MLLPLLVLTLTGGPANGEVRDGFDPDAFDPATGEPARVRFGQRLEAADAERRRATPELDRFEDEDAEPRRQQWFWAQRANHRGQLGTDPRWEFFFGERPKRLLEANGAPAAQWTTMGPNTMQDVGGRMLCLAFHPGKPETLYAGSNSGGLWRSRNGGLLWEPLTDHLPAMSVSSVALNPANPDEILIGTGWGSFAAVSLYPGVGVLRSTDGGLTWNTTSFSFPLASGVGTFEMAWDPVVPGRVHLAANNGYYRSLDGGVTWQLRRAGLCTGLVVHPRNPDTLYAAFGGGGIWRSFDGGETLQLLATGLPPNAETLQLSLAICASQPNVLYTLITQATSFCSRGLFKTVNGGDSWTQITSAPDVMRYASGPPCYGWAFNVVSVSPWDPNLVLIGGIRVYRTANGGTTWSQKDYSLNLPAVDPYSGELYVDNHAFLWHPNLASFVYGANDGGVWKSLTAGNNWLPVSEGLMTGLIYRIASAATRPEVVVAGTQDHGIQRVDHSGGNLRWTQWTLGDGEWICIDPTDDRLVYGSINMGMRRSSSDGAVGFNQWTSIMSGITESSFFQPPLVMDPTNPAVLWTATTARIYKTTDRGALWVAKANIPNVATIAIDHVNPDIVYAHAYTSSTWQLWRTLDGGANWSQLTHASIPGWRVTDLETDPHTSGVVYATRNSGFAGQDHVKRSTNFGITWTDITANLPDVPTSAIAVSPVNASHLYLATDLGVFLSVDGGGSWSEWNDGLPLVYATDIHYLEADHTVRVGTMGRGVWKSPAFDQLVGVDPAAGPLALQGLRVAPNPSHGVSRVSFTLAREASVSVAVFDLTGQRVRTLIEGERGAGAHEVEWDGRNASGRAVAAGVYFVRLLARGRAHVARVQRL